MADPFACAPGDRDHYGQLVARACRSDDQQAARVAWMALARWAHWADVSATVTARLTDLDDRSLWQLVVPGLIALIDAGRSGSVLVDVTARLTDLDLAAASADDPGRDRPARQRLNLLVSRAADWASRADPDLDRGPLGDAGRYLARQPDLTLQAVTLLLAALHLHQGDGQELADRLTEICDLVAGEPVVASRIGDALARRVASGTRAQPEAIRAGAELLEGDGRLCAGLLAVALARYGHRLARRKA